MSATVEPLRTRQTTRVEWLEEKWDQISPRQSSEPIWLRQLALQLELWVGSELDTPQYLEASHEAPAPPVVPGDRVENNAWNSTGLYLRAVTAGHFVAIDVSKAAFQSADARVTVFVAPRASVRSLQASEWSSRGGEEPDTIRLTVMFDGSDQAFTLPFADDYIHAKEWREGNAEKLFLALRDDLRGAAGEAVIAVD